MAKKTRTKKRGKGTFSIVCSRGTWKVIGSDGEAGKQIVGSAPPCELSAETIVVQHVIQNPPLIKMPSHKHKGKGGKNNPPYNTHCHKTIYINGVPYLVHC